MPFPFTLAISNSTSVKYIFSRSFSTQRADCKRTLSDFSNGENPSSGHSIRGLPSLFLSLLLLALKFHVFLVLILVRPYVSNSTVNSKKNATNFLAMFIFPLCGLSSKLHRCSFSYVSAIRFTSAYPEVSWLCMYIRQNRHNIAHMTSLEIGRYLSLYILSRICIP